jgi:hypothetical protein
MTHITIERTKLEQVLEALEYIDREDNDRDFLLPFQCVMLDKAITAIKQALAAQPAQQEPTEGQVKELADRYGLDASMLGALRNFADAYHANTTPPAAPVQPVAWLEILRNNRTATDEVIGAFLRGHAEHLTGETFVLTTPPAALPFGVGGGLVAIKTLLSRDPCVHANTAIEMIDAILKEHPAAQPAVPDAMTSADIQEHIEYVAGWNDCRAEMLKGMKP